MLTADQAAALEALAAFMADPQQTSFLLDGGAGVGKTFLLAQFVREHQTGVTVVCAPTHKALNVLRRKLDAAGVSWEAYKPRTKYTEDSGVVTGTSAQMLGLVPIIAENQSAEERHFGYGDGPGAYARLQPALLVIDEVSMLSWPGFHDLHQQARELKGKILAVGDSAQLPPVNEQAIPFEAFRFRAHLREIVRQAKDSAIIQLAWAIRDERPWRDIAGSGIRRVEALADAYLEQVAAPRALPEGERSVYIAYRNACVDAVQEAACQKLYGHGRKAFEQGELVLSESSVPNCCVNQDELVVDEFGRRDSVRGVAVRLHRLGKSRRDAFEAFYLSPEELADKKHPYNVEKEDRRTRAQAIQSEWNRSEASVRRALDAKRRLAWVDYFEWAESIITFRHPFAITSHKSQGSTYRRVYADTQDLARFSKQALYVAVTRPSEELVIPR